MTPANRRQPRARSGDLEWRPERLDLAAAPLIRQGLIVSQTGQESIDLQLARAGWAVGSRRLIEEFLVETPAVLNEPGGLYRTANEFADYALLDRLRRVLAIVEAKRSSRDALDGERQAADYADALRAKTGTDPFVFLANGDEIWFWHRRLYPPRKVSGFFTEEDLTRLAHLDRYGKPLIGAMPRERIIDRAYQTEAVKTIAERIEAAKRRFLMVLATGTGKTRVAAVLVELLQRLERIQRVLFLADRRELVKQALGAFKEHLPGSPRSWIEGGSIDSDAQIHFATYPGMMSLYQRLSPGYYDLIIADESHRSIYSRYKAILDHFDAINLGLTATPTDFIDHNTFELFDCPSDSPTFYYGYDEAVRDKYLVPYRPVHVARTGFQIEGLKPGELPDEVKQQVRTQGIDPDQYSFEGSDLERKVTNTGTNDAIVREFMDHAVKDAAGTLPAKTIIFAISHNHALELYKSFNRLYPDLQRKGLAKVIDSQMNFYLNWWKAHGMEDADNPPVGMIRCSDRDQAAVEYATAGMDQKLFVSRYLVALPSVEKLRAFLEADRDRIELHLASAAPEQRRAPKSKKPTRKR
jgi:type I restriction enzyme, R subunit